MYISTAFFFLSSLFHWSTSYSTPLTYIYFLSCAFPFPFAHLHKPTMFALSRAIQPAACRVVLRQPVRFRPVFLPQSCLRLHPPSQSSYSIAHPRWLSSSYFTSQGALPANISRNLQPSETHERATKNSKEVIVEKWLCCEYPFRLTNHSPSIIRNRSAMNPR